MAGISKISIFIFINASIASLESISLFLESNILVPFRFARIAKIKGVKLERSNFSFICYDLSNLSDYVTQIETPIFKLLKRTLPGPYTYILPGASTLPHPFKKKKTCHIKLHIEQNLLNHNTFQPSLHAFHQQK